MNRQEKTRKIVARALLAAMSGSALVAIATTAHAEPLQVYRATMTPQEYFDWMRKGGPRFCEMMPDLLSYTWLIEADVQHLQVQQVATEKQGL